MLGRLGVPELLVILLVVAASLAVIVWPASRICKRLGFSPWLGIIAVVPVANVALLWFVAVTPWTPPAVRLEV